ncbi:MAG: hypothetical protein AB8B93_18135 [Pseudomonadales bacterium]
MSGSAKQRARRPKNSIPAGLSLVLLLLATHAGADTQSVLDPDRQALADCTALRDREQRLTCYDTVAGRWLKMPLPAAPANDSKAAAATDPAAEFGMNQVVAERRGTKVKETAPEAISAVVVSISKRANGTLVLSLDNDQIWQQRKKDRGLRVKVGDTVTIKRGVLGGYRLTARGNKAFKVTRLK